MNFSRKTRPLYQKLRNFIAQDIASGLYPAGSVLPTTAQLCRQYQVSHNTVELAVRLLADEQLIRRGRGRRARVLTPGGKYWIGIINNDYGDYGEVDYLDGPWGWIFHNELQRRIRDEHHTALHLSPLRLEPEKLKAFSGLLFLTSCRRFSDEDFPARLNLPWVMLHAGERPPETNAVILDYSGCARQIATYFMANGVRHFLLGGLRTDYRQTDNRLSEFYQALAERGVDPAGIKEIADAGNPVFTQASRAAIRNWLATHPGKVGGVFWTDWKARQFCDLAAECGRTIKKDVFAVGISGLPESAAQMPALSTLDIPFGEITRQMLRMLYGMIRQGTRTCPNKVFRLKFVPRGT